MGGTRIILKGIDIYKYKNVGITSMLAFVAAPSVMERSL